MSGERCTSGEADGGMMECVKFPEGTLGCHPIDSVAIVKYREDGHLDKSVSGRAGERRFIPVQEAQSSFDFVLQVFYVSREGKGWV